MIQSKTIVFTSTANLDLFFPDRSYKDQPTSGPTYHRHQLEDGLRGQERRSQRLSWLCEFKFRLRRRGKPLDGIKGQ